MARLVILLMFGGLISFPGFTVHSAIMAAPSKGSIASEKADNPHEDVSRTATTPHDLEVRRTSADITATKDATVQEPDSPPHSIFSKRQRILYVYAASIAAFSSPVSSSIYYPAMLTLARDLDTSLTNISLTVTTYMIFQGIAPTFVGGISDRIGRRPAYLMCFSFYAVVNIGLALQTNFVALILLRCLQSCGCSGTGALSSATVSDVATRQQRGSYIGLAALGSSMGPALGPLIGGLLTFFLGWRAIFWFLAIWGGFMFILYLVFIPETCRNIVGNGSVPPQRWNKPLIQYLRKQSIAQEEARQPGSTAVKKKRPSIISSIPILLDKETFLLTLYGGLIYAGYYVILTGLPQQLSSTYNYNSIQVGLCYIPLGAGPLLFRPIIGRIMDAVFRRYALKSGKSVSDNKQYDIADFPIERARLFISLFFVYLSSCAVIPYGWIMNLQHPPLPAALVMLFIVGLCTSALFQPVTALLVDVHPTSPAAASAAFNLVRCLLGAAGAALVNPMLNSIGRGWTSTLVAAIWIGFSPCWWIIAWKGLQWRKQQEVRKAQSQLREGRERKSKRAANLFYLKWCRSKS